MRYDFAKTMLPLVCKFDPFFILSFSINYMFTRAIASSITLGGYNSH